MNKFKFYFILFSTLLVLFSSCNKDDDEVASTPLNDYGVQHTADTIIINKYLKTHKLNPEIIDYEKNVNNPNLFIVTSNVSESLWKLPKTGSSYPKLLTKEVTIESHNSTKYFINYIVFNEGDATEKPCPFDEVLVTYRGTSLANETGGAVSETEFDSSPTATKLLLTSTNISVLGTIAGWQKILPLFGKGIFDEVATGNDPNVYTNYGAGVMFLPSGLGYFNQSRTNIPSYSPLIFSFQLQNFIRVDNDNDGIMTVDELSVNSEGKYADTDGDGIYDFGDFDDDNDGYPTRNEIKKPTPFQGTSLYYPFNPIVDNPLTTDIDESELKGIPDKSGDFSTPTRVRRHLDKTAKPPYTTY